MNGIDVKFSLKINITENVKKKLLFLLIGVVVSAFCLVVGFAVVVELQSNTPERMSSREKARAAGEKAKARMETDYPRGYLTEEEYKVRRDKALKELGL